MNHLRRIKNNKLMEIKIRTLKMSIVIITEQNIIKVIRSSQKEIKMILILMLK